MKKHLNTLYVTRDKTWLALDGETVNVKLKGESLLRIPLHNIEGIQCFGWDILASPALLSKCAQKGIMVSFCNPNGKLLCRVSGFTQGNVLLRRAQYRVADSPEQSLTIAREMVAAKILNARQVLLRACRDKAALEGPLEPAIREMAFSVKLARVATDAPTLLGIEGRAAELYFGALPQLISNKDFSFNARNRRPPKDKTNALLSFTYALLTHDCRSALEACGLDAAVGVYHKDRPGRPSLALDLMEELRAPLADRLVLSLINRRQVKEADFCVDEAGGVTIADEARRKLLTAWQDRKKEEIIHPYLQERLTIGMIVHIQARLLAQHLRGMQDAYVPMLWR